MLHYFGILERVKYLMSNKRCNKYLWILFPSTYHPTLLDDMTPIEFKYALGLNSLLLIQYEFDLLVANFVWKYSAQSHFINIPEDVKIAIFNVTGRHPGLCHFILSMLRTHFCEGTINIESLNILWYLASADLHDGIVGYHTLI